MRILQIAQIALQKGTGCIFETVKMFFMDYESLTKITIAHFVSFEVDDTVLFTKQILCQLLLQIWV